MCLIPIKAKHTVYFGVILATLCGGVGCTRGTSEASAANSQIRAEYDKMGKLTRLNYDRNKNNRTDTVAYMDGTRIVRIEIDSDENGAVDRWEYYANQKLEKVGSSSVNDGVVDTWASHDSDGKLAKIEVSTHRDGKIDHIEFYKSGELASTEEDLDGDGRPDKWETYRDGALTKVAFDTRRLGKPDRQIIYDTAGGVDRIEADVKSNGTFEVLGESR
jgi:antitoxin component YwqK of YwqJK toxin-antitoxin module